MNRKSLAGKLVGVLTVVTVIAFLISGAYITNKVSMVVSDISGTSTVNQVKGISEEIDAYFKEKVAYTKSIAQSNIFRKYVMETEEVGKDREASKRVSLYPTVAKTMKNLRGMDENLRMVFIGLHENNNLVTKDIDYKVNDDFDLHKRGWYIDTLAKKDSHVTSPYHDAMTGELVVTASTPMYDGNRILGTVAVDIDIAKIAEVMEGYKQGNSYAVLVDSEGKFIYHPNSEYILEKHVSDLSSALATIEQKMIGGKSGLEEYKYNGIKKYMAFNPIESTGWSVAMTMDEADVYGEVNALRNTVMVIYLLTAIIIVGSIYYIARKSLKDVPKLVNGLKTVADGNLNVSVDIKSDDEIGEISDSFNKMLVNLKSLVTTSKSISNNLLSSSTNLAALSEEVNASSEEVGRSVEEISTGLVDQATSAQDGAVVASKLDSEMNNLVSNSKEMLDSSKVVSSK
jgi:methyl-accepting chemotaxis protein